MTLFEEILKESNILNEAPRKKLSRRRRLKQQTPKQNKRKVLKPSNNKDNGGFVSSYTLTDKINDAINNMYPVVMNYNSGGENLATGQRTIYPIAYGLSKANNPVIRAFEPKGDTVRGVPAWKFFRVDRIISWENVENERFDPSKLNGVNKTGDMLMTRVYNISPFGKGKDVDRSQEFINIGPNAITKQDIEHPELNVDKNKTYSADNVIDDILRNIQQQNKNVDNSPQNIYINNKQDKINAPETKPITKQELGPENNVEPNEQPQNTQNTSVQDTKPVYKDELENNENNNEIPSQENPNNNRFVNFFKNLTNRMNNLYKNNNEG